MKVLRNIATQGVWLLGVAALLAGCKTYTFEPFPGESSASTGASGTGDKPYVYREVFYPGDVVQVSFAGTESTQPLPTHIENIKEDGTIKPPYLKSPVVAANKRPGELQNELQDLYNAVFRNITVTVRPGERFFYVDGEVNRRGQIPYVGPTDIIKAIAAAGGFTEFAKETKVRLIRPDGKTEIVNYPKVLEGVVKSPEVYPGDKIVVKRRLFFK